MDLIRRLRWERKQEDSRRRQSSLPEPSLSDDTAEGTSSPFRGLSPHPISRETHRCPGPNELFYIPNLISEEEESFLLRAVEMGDPWVQLKTRRLKCFDEDVAPHSWLSLLIESLVSKGVWDNPNEPPNHVLINDYLPGEGIMHHTDGPLYRDYVVILSLGSSAMMSFRANLKTSEIGLKAQHDIAKVFLLPRSALLFLGETYSDFLHGIEAITHDEFREDMGIVNLDALPSTLRGTVARGRRVSLTIRRKLS